MADENLPVHVGAVILGNHGKHFGGDKAAIRVGFAERRRAAGHGGTVGMPDWLAKPYTCARPSPFACPIGLVVKNGAGALVNTSWFMPIPVSVNRSSTYSPGMSRGARAAKTFSALMRRTRISAFAANVHGRKCVAGLEAVHVRHLRRGEEVKVIALKCVHDRLQHRHVLAP